MLWIKHDTDANQDAKLQNVLLDYGLEGYGLYWYCLELIAGKVDKNNITFELEHDARIIARNVGSTTIKVEEIMRYFVEIGLFECSNNTITCLKLAKRLDQSMTSNPQMREIIKNFKSHDAVMTNHDGVMQDKIRLDKSKEDLIGSSEDKPSKKKKTDYCEEFEWIWANKPNREGSNPKRQAYSACNARRKEGATWREMAEGLNRYKAYCKAKGLENTSMVQQMTTFFGTKESFRESWGFKAQGQDQKQEKVITDKEHEDIKRKNELEAMAMFRSLNDE